MIGVDLFAGSGGLSLGARQAGIDVRLAVEADEHAAQTYAHNHTCTPVLVDDICKLHELKISSEGQPTILFGGPPCQGFSTSNQKTRTLYNQSNWLYTEFLRVAKLWRANWILLETVGGIAETAGGAFLKSIVDGMKSQGYDTQVWVLNAVDFGVPQRRSRVFVLGAPPGLSLEKPRPTMTEPVTVREAISDLPDLPNGASIDCLPHKSIQRSPYARLMSCGRTDCSNHVVTKNADYVIERYQHIPQGGNWGDIPASLMLNYSDRLRCHTGIYHRLREDTPSTVIGNYRKNMLVHPTQDRGLSVREAARLQSFPDWYEFKGTIGFQQQQVGNAVPPLLAQRVFEVIVAHASN